MVDTVPVELLAVEHQAVGIADMDTPTQFPQFLLFEIPRSIGIDVALDMELLVELLHEDTLLERPARRLLDSVDVPALSDNLVLDNTGIGYQRIDAIASHHRCRVAVPHGRGCMFLVLSTGNEERQLKQYECCKHRRLS